MPILPLVPALATAPSISDAFLMPHCSQDPLELHLLSMFLCPFIHTYEVQAHDEKITED